MELGPAQAASPTGLQLSNSGYEGHILFLLFPKLHSNGPFNWLLYDLPWVRREHPQPLGFTHPLQVRSHPPCLTEKPPYSLLFSGTSPTYAYTYKRHRFVLSWLPPSTSARELCPWTLFSLKAV